MATQNQGTQDKKKRTVNRPKLSDDQKAKLAEARSKANESFFQNVASAIDAMPDVFFSTRNESRIHVVRDNGSEFVLTLRAK